MKDVTIIGVDLAKKAFQLHGAASDGTVVFRKELSRPQFHRFMAEHPRCVIAMEACGGANHWARELVRLGQARASHRSETTVNRERLTTGIRRPGA